MHMLEYLQAFDNCIRFVLNKTKCLNSCETWDLLLYNKPMKKLHIYLLWTFAACVAEYQLGHIWGHLAVVHLDLGPSWKVKELLDQVDYNHNGTMDRPLEADGWGEKGSYGGEASVFSPEDGEKKFAFPHGHWQNEMDLCFFSLAKGQLSNWIGKNGRCNGARHCRKHACLL